MTLTLEDIRVLRRAASGRKRLTEQLCTAVSNLAYEICNNTEIGDEVEVEGRYLVRKEVVSNIGSEPSLEYSDIVEDREPSFTRSHDYPSTETYLHRDLNAYIAVPIRAQIIWFAEHAKEIVAKFAELQKQKISKTEDALEKVKDEMIKCVGCGKPKPKKDCFKVNEKPEYVCKDCYDEKRYEYDPTPW